MQRIERPNLTYDLIKEAVAQEPEALEAVLLYYDGYLNRLSSREYAGNNGKFGRFVDLDMKQSLSQRLAMAIPKWKEMEE